MLPLTDHDVNCLRLSTAQDFNWSGLAHHIAAEACEKFIVMKDGNACNCNENIANDQTTFGRRTIILNTHDQKAGGLLAFEDPLRSAGDFDSLTANAKITALDMTMGGECLCDLPCNVGGNRDGSTASQPRCIKTQYCPICGDKRATRKTGIGNAIGANV